MKLGRLDAAIEFFNEPLDGATHLSDECLQVRMLSALATAKVKLGQDDEAVTLLERATSFDFSKNYNRMEHVIALVELCEILCANERYAHVYTYARQGIGICHPKENYDLVVRLLLSLVRSLHAVDRLDEARHEAEHTLAMLDESVDLRLSEVRREFVRLKLI